MYRPRDIERLGGRGHVHACTSTYRMALPTPPNCVWWFYTARWIVFPLWLEIVIIFYFLSGYWLWKLINIFYYCDFVAIIHWIGEGNGNPLQYSCLENPGDRGAWGLLSIGSHRVGHDWSDLAAVAAAACGLFQTLILSITSVYIHTCIYIYILILFMSNFTK